MCAYTSIVHIAVRIFDISNRME